MTIQEQSVSPAEGPTINVNPRGDVVRIRRLGPDSGTWLHLKATATALAILGAAVALYFSITGFVRDRITDVVKGAGDAVHRYITEANRDLRERLEEMKRSAQQIGEMVQGLQRAVADVSRRQASISQDVGEVRDLIAAQGERASEHAATDVLARDPALQRTFDCLLRKGSTQLAFGGGHEGELPAIWWQKVEGEPPAPASLRRLRELRVLDFLKQFVRAMTDPTNDRGSWPQPADEADWAEYERRFRAFVRVAPEWEKMGLLSP